MCWPSPPIVICPMMLSRGDLSETLETASWYLILLKSGRKAGGPRRVHRHLQPGAGPSVGNRAERGGRTVPVPARL